MVCVKRDVRAQRSQIPLYVHSVTPWSAVVTAADVTSILGGMIRPIQTTQCGGACQLMSPAGNPGKGGEGCCTVAAVGGVSHAAAAAAGPGEHGEAW